MAPAPDAAYQMLAHELFHSLLRDDINRLEADILHSTTFFQLLKPATVAPLRNGCPYNFSQLELLPNYRLVAHV